MWQPRTGSKVYKKPTLGQKYRLDRAIFNTLCFRVHQKISLQVSEDETSLWQQNHTTHVSQWLNGRINGKLRNNEVYGFESKYRYRYIFFSSTHVEIRELVLLSASGPSELLGWGGTHTSSTSSPTSFNLALGLAFLSFPGKEFGPKLLCYSHER